jgi:hypothetical protein
MTYCGWKQKLRESSRCAMATIARRNSPNGNCHPQLKRHEKREKLPQQLGKSHGLREKRQRKPSYCGKFITTEKALEAGIGVRWIPEAHPTLADDCRPLMKNGPPG